jgi:hypothetical protein
MTMTVNPVAVMVNGMKRHARDEDLIEGIISLTFGGSDTYVGRDPAVAGALLDGPHLHDRAEAVERRVLRVRVEPATQKMVVFSVAGTQLANNSTALQNDTVVLRALGF